MIVLLVDSPGGSVYGIAELANKINALKGEKKIIGMADSVAASAAYWLASQCSELVCCPGGQVGSIGVLAAHEDQSGAAEQAGVKTTLVTSSKYKGEGNPFGPMDDDARAEIQSKVDAYHAMFVAAVARGRGVSEGVVNKTFGQGRMSMAVPAGGWHGRSCDHLPAAPQGLGERSRRRRRSPQRVRHVGRPPSTAAVVGQVGGAADVDAGPASRGRGRDAAERRAGPRA